MMKVLCPILESGKIRTLSTAVKDDPILVQIYHLSDQKCALKMYAALSQIRFTSGSYSYKDRQDKTKGLAERPGKFARV